MRVLIADDQARLRSSLKALVSTLPQVESVQEVVDGTQTIRLVSEWKPDVVIMDVRMGEVDGVQATREIKALAPHVRVIVLTLYPEYREAALAAGASEFLIKDGSSQHLLSAIVNA